MHKLLVFFLGVLSVGCASTPAIRLLEIPESSTWFEVHKDFIADPSSAHKWWLQFEDVQLNFLVAESLKNNSDLAAQLKVIEQFRANAGYSRANSWPVLGGQAEVERGKQSSKVVPIEFGGGSSASTFLVGASLNYEIDLWGRLKHERNIAQAQLSQSEFSMQTLRQMLIAEVVSVYINMLVNYEFIELLKEIEVYERELLNFTQVIYASGDISRDKVLQQKLSLHHILQQINRARKDYYFAKTNLALLVGLPIERLISELNFEHARLSDLRIIEHLPNVLPSDLLQDRPDIRAAEAELEAASARIGVAKAARLPSFNLMAFVGSAAPVFGDLFTQGAETYSTGLNMAGPLYDFRRSKSRIRQAEHAFAEATARYEGIVRTAVVEALDAMEHYSKALNYHDLEARKTGISRQRLIIVMAQYFAGEISHDDVLLAQQQLISSQIDEAASKAGLLLSITGVYRSLGGDMESGVGRQ